MDHRVPVELEVWKGNREVIFPGLLPCRYSPKADVVDLLLRFATERVPDCSSLFQVRDDPAYVLRVCMNLSGDRKAALEVYDILRSRQDQDLSEVLVSRLADAPAFSLAGRPRLMGRQQALAALAAAEPELDQVGDRPKLYFSDGVGFRVTAYRGLSATRVEVWGHAGYDHRPYDNSEDKYWDSPMHLTWAKGADGWRIIRWDVGRIAPAKVSTQEAVFEAAWERLGELAKHSSGSPPP